MKKRRNPTKKEWLEAIEECCGVVTLVATRLGVTRQAVYKRILADKEIEAAIAGARERIVDLAEGQLIKLIREGNVKSVLFTLATQGKKRGYTPRHEVTGPDGGPIEVTADELDRRIARLAERLGSHEDPGGAD